MAEGKERAEEIILNVAERAEKSISVLSEEYASVRAGRANPHLLDKITVDYYGTPSPINQVGNISLADAKCLVISPWDASLLKNIEKAIIAANIGINPTNDGKVIRLVFPDLTEERRKELAKQTKKLGEDAKVAVRNVRRDGMDALKKMKTAKELTEDETAEYEKEIEKEVSKSIEKIEKMQAEKEKDIMSV